MEPAVEENTPVEAGTVEANGLTEAGIDEEKGLEATDALETPREPSDLNDPPIPEEDESIEDDVLSAIMEEGGFDAQDPEDDSSADDIPDIGPAGTDDSADDASDTMPEAVPVEEVAAAPARGQRTSRTARERDPINELLTSAPGRKGRVSGNRPSTSSGSSIIADPTWLLNRSNAHVRKLNLYIDAVRAHRANPRKPLPEPLIMTVTTLLPQNFEGQPVLKGYYKTPDSGITVLVRWEDAYPDFKAPTSEADSERMRDQAMTWRGMEVPFFPTGMNSEEEPDGHIARYVYGDVNLANRHLRMRNFGAGHPIPNGGPYTVWGKIGALTSRTVDVYIGGARFTLNASEAVDDWLDPGKYKLGSYLNANYFGKYLPSREEIAAFAKGHEPEYYPTEHMRKSSDSVLNWDIMVYMDGVKVDRRNGYKVTAEEVSIAKAYARYSAREAMRDIYDVNARVTCRVTNNNYRNKSSGRMGYYAVTDAGVSILVLLRSSSYGWQMPDVGATTTVVIREPYVDKRDGQTKYIAFHNNTIYK